MNLLTNNYKKELNEILKENERKDISTYKQYLKLPLKKFLINSSHNSYIHSTQHFGFSTYKSIQRCLDMGARCLELDIHESNSDIYVAHGNDKVLSTTRIKVKECLEVINLFDTTDPIIICLEIFINTDSLKVKLNKIVKEVFKDRLLNSIYKKTNPYAYYIDDTPIENLLNKIILINSQSENIE
jgi:hypothetical protein